MAKQKQSKAAKIRALLAEGVVVKDIAKKLKLDVNYVHQVKWHWKNDAKKTLDATAKVEAEEVVYSPMETHFAALKQADDERDVVNHPTHYTVGGIEVIDFIEAKKLGYHLGNVVKYISRVDHKDDPIENLEKARWYLDREIEKRREVAVDW